MIVGSTGVRGVVGEFTAAFEVGGCGGATVTLLPVAAEAPLLAPAAAELETAAPFTVAPALVEPCAAPDAAAPATAFAMAAAAEADPPCAVVAP